MEIVPISFKKFDGSSCIVYENIASNMKLRASEVVCGDSELSRLLNVAAEALLNVAWHIRKRTERGSKIVHISNGGKQTDEAINQEFNRLSSKIKELPLVVPQAVEAKNSVIEEKNMW
jgi:hypothetical protein